VWTDEDAAVSGEQAPFSFSFSFSFSHLALYREALQFALQSPD
jgi:hypothetical protein